MLGVDYQSRYVDNNYRVAEALKQGLLGTPILGEVRFKWFRSQEYFEHGGGWRGTWAMDGGGSLANQGSHLIDLLLWFMGVPKTVYGETAIMNHDIETEDIGQAILNFESGAKGGILGTTTFPASPYFSAEVHGSEGGVLLDAVLSGEMRVFGDGLEEKLLAIEQSADQRRRGRGIGPRDRNHPAGGRPRRSPHSGTVGKHLPLSAGRKGSGLP